MSLNDWTIKVGEILADFGFTIESLKYDFVAAWKSGISPRSAALLAIKENI